MNLYVPFFGNTTFARDDMCLIARRDQLRLRPGKLISLRDSRSEAAPEFGCG
jgi:hypothetical protein